MMCRAPDLPPGAGPGPMGEGLRAMDKNKDGKISKDEYTGPAPFFDRLDRNSDGFISSDELPRAGARAEPEPGVPDAHRLLEFALGRHLAEWSGIVPNRLPGYSVRT
jgi:EF hand domain-containing protein